MQPNKYNGKELDLMHGLNTYDYGARQYDPITVTLNGMEPLVPPDFYLFGIIFISIGL